MTGEKIKLKLYNAGFSKKEMYVVLFLLLLTFLYGSLKIYKVLFPGVSNFHYEASDKNFFSFSQDSSFRLISAENDSSVMKELITYSNVKPKKSAMLKDRKINLNKADKSELMQLPGVGQKMAERIIEYRGNQKFKKTEDLLKVKGIGEKKFAQIKKYLIIN